MSQKALHSSLKEIYHAALRAVDPEVAVKRLVHLTDQTLLVDNRTYSLKDRKIFLAGTGKAGVPMARALEKILGPQLESGLIVVKHGWGGKLERTSVLEAGHPEPDLEGVKAAQLLIDFLNQKITSDDLLLFVISGGGSALLPAPVSEISFEDKRSITRLLLNSGATIHELNTIRKHLSRIKGGKLLEHLKGTQVICLILSDVVGDDLGSIASGPTAPDSTTFKDSIDILQKYGLEKTTPASVLRYLRSGLEDNNSTSIKETPKPGDGRFETVQNIIVGNNFMALDAAAKTAESLGFHPLILSSSIVGDTSEAARLHVSIAREIIQSGHPIAPPCCLISGGETTVRVKGDGKGGRNQEFVLCCAQEIANWEYPAILFASLGSDGDDGPTDAAGAIATPGTATCAESKSLSIQHHLESNDSYHFFLKLGDQIITGPTQTNVMDLRFVLIGEPGVV